MDRNSEIEGRRPFAEAPAPARPDEPLPEGEEGPPPGVRGMGVLRWALVALMALAAVGSWTYHVTADARGASRAGARYHCPMHPSAVADHAGSCPICGMDLVPVAPAAPSKDASARKKASDPPAAKVPATAGAYWCPMHPEVSSDDPNATCSKCGGMKLMPRPRDAGGPSAAPGPAGHAAGEKAPQPPGAVPASARGAYWCPMHPEVSSDDPNATCSKCGGMKLMPRPPDAGAQPERPAPHGVRGLVPFDLGPERVQLIGVRTAPVTREKLAPALRTLGVVSPAETGIALVSTRFAGWVEDLRVSQSGQFVRKGEVLASLVSPDLDGLQLTYLNAVEWMKKNDAGPELLQQGEALERQARDRLLRAGVSEADVRQLARAGRPLRALTVRAPVSGFVGKKSAVAGLYVQPGAELFEIADLSTVWVVADVYEPDFDRVKVGQGAEVRLPALPHRAFAGRVEFLYPAVNPGSRTLQARIALANRGLELRPGMSADVTLDLGAQEALVVPAEAVVDTGDEQYVFVAQDGGRFVPFRVRLGSRADGKVELLDGPAEGERVVTTANFLLDSESRLRAALGGPSAAGSPAEAASYARGP